MSINTEHHPKAELAILYRKEIHKAVNELSQYHEEYGSLILSVLEENPKINPEELKEIVFEKFERDYKPYNDQRLNDALIEVSVLGIDAVDELKAIIDVLGSTIDLEAAKEKLADKYGEKLDGKNTTLQSYRNESTFSAPINNSNENSHDREILISAGQSALQGIKPKDELNVDVEDFSAQNLSESKQEQKEVITKVPIGDGRYEYAYGGKNFYSYDAAERARNSESYDTLKASPLQTKDFQNHRLEEALSGIKTGVVTGYIQIAISLVAVVFLTIVAVSKDNLFSSDVLELLLPWYLITALLVFLVYKLKNKSYFAAIALFTIVIAPPIGLGILVGPFEAIRGGLWTILFGYGFYRGVYGTKLYRQIIKEQGEI